MLIVDDTGVVKKGTTSAGVQRQYSGTAGRTENCQIGVFTAYASARGRALVDRELYLPKSWTEDRERCRTARVPDEREFATKGELARHMVLRAVASPLPIAWVTADSAYGQENRFRRLLEQSGVGYVLAVPKSRFCVGCSPIEVLFAQAPDEAWEKISCGNGAKGPPRLPLDSGAAAGRRRVRLSGRGPSPDAVGTGPAQHQQARRDRPLRRLHPFRSPSRSWCGSPGHAGRSRNANRWDSRDHRAHSGGGSATPGSLSCPAPAPERTPSTTPRAELVELAPPTPSSRPPLSLPAALSHDRGAVSVRPPPHDRSPATLQPPSGTRRSDSKVLLEY
ncbi:IS701 family transposase [Streptomyces sp. NPDC048845]|uniref:IS701 family transposase n=1 Tax=Streptomyces sp. NPDC048845 TaxID=3155390 RepID=UPI00343D7861